ncbi:DUF1566 domain-containing protein [Pseudomonas petrae]|uniref:DUF1566 domain-containing protein n=1 Tax=Pseudomonas petrae TaxID=2912190 RepID=A0ABS9I807_9PSED|nr:DUF1566 domain-containing protein [Pseudomonas petrae]MCF7543893.1 DUF1566 domain-containing protein [Pseudomonas petrae]
MRLATALLASLQKIPTDPGVPYSGGYYVGRLKISGQSYALIVSPKALGETTLAWKPSGGATLNADSVWDGFSNTAAMVADAASYPAAQFCAGLSINGYADWFLPAKDQLELCYRNLKPKNDNNSTSGGYNANSDPAGTSYTATNPQQTSAEAFKYTLATGTYGPEAFSAGSGQIYWSSTNASASAASTQEFLSGSQSSSTKFTQLLVRAVRMIKI